LSIAPAEIRAQQSSTNRLDGEKFWLQAEVSVIYNAPFKVALRRLKQRRRSFGQGRLPLS
jgi:hypothetical protein